MRRIAAVLHDTQGDLKAATLEVTRLPQAWTPLVKLRTPMDHVVAAMRALDLPQADRPPADRPELEGVLAALGQPMMSAPLPNGWPDRAADWSGGEALLRRVDWIWGLAGRVQADPLALAEASLGPLLSPETAAQIRNAGSRREALTLALASPEFLRR